MVGTGVFMFFHNEATELCRPWMLMLEWRRKREKSDLRLPLRPCLQKELKKERGKEIATSCCTRYVLGSCRSRSLSSAGLSEFWVEGKAEGAI